MAEDAKISKLTIADLDAVDDLMKDNSGTLGFLPLEAIKDYLQKEWVLGVKTESGLLLGYLMYAVNRDRFRIVQLCILKTSRRQGIARKLLEALKESASTQKVILLRCRNDFPANDMWSRLEFVPISESRGRSKEGHFLTLWRRQLALDEQLSLSPVNTSDEVLDAVIDSQIFFDFDEPDNDTVRPSKALISDFFVDSLNLRYTDEILSEINRNDNADERKETRDRLTQFLEIKHDPTLVEHFKESLNRILPSHTESQRSDINHLAKTAASEFDIFVTRDEVLQNKATQIAEVTNIHVLSPTALIIKLRELFEKQPYTPDNVSGPGLVWRRLTSEELMTFPFDLFLEQGERVWELRSRIDAFLADSSEPELEVFWSGKDPVAFRILAYDLFKTLTVFMCKVIKSDQSLLIRQFLVSDMIHRAVIRRLDMVKVESSALPSDLLPDLSEMGFIECDDGFVRFCFTEHLERDELLSKITALHPNSIDNYRDMSYLELEHHCSPLISGVEQNYFLISIRPEYALNLFDRQQSSYHLFGGTPDVLLRWNNVYYRAATHHNMLKAPGRILWYVSRDPKAIIAVSHLDEVVIDTPKELFRRFRKYGTLEWRDLYEMCDRDVSKELMALKFSHTFSFHRPVPLADLRKVFGEDEIGLAFPSPQNMPFGTFNKLVQLGYPEQS